MRQSCVGGNNINNLKYADETVLIANLEEKLKTSLQQSQSKEKTKDFNWMQRLSAWSSQNSQTFLYIPFFANMIKQVDTFKYLGFTITQDARCDTEIKKRIALSKDTLTKMKSIFTNRNIKVYTKINTLKAYLWFILLHGCECWPLTKDLERRLGQQKCGI